MLGQKSGLESFFVRDLFLNNKFNFNVNKKTFKIFINTSNEGFRDLILSFFFVNFKNGLILFFSIKI